MGAKAVRTKSMLSAGPSSSSSYSPRNDGTFSGLLKALYNDPFKWQVVKSWSMFCFGVYLARELSGVDILAPPPAM